MSPTAAAITTTTTTTSGGNGENSERQSDLQQNLQTPVITQQIVSDLPNHIPGQHQRHNFAGRTRSAPGSAGETRGERSSFRWKKKKRGSGDSSGTTAPGFFPMMSEWSSGSVGGGGGQQQHHYNYLTGMPDQASFLSAELRARLICDGTLPFHSWVSSRAREGTASGSGSFWGKSSSETERQEADKVS